MDSYEDLELVNIHSTIDILSGLSKMESPCRQRGGPIWTVPVQAGVCSSLQSKLRRDLDTQVATNIKIASKLGLET
jgi:hypothetical protein